MKTTENNKLIAEFMGNKNYLYNNDKYSNYFFLTDSEGNELKESYNTDWNWLMEVVERIEDLTDKDSFILYDVVIYPDAIIITDQEEHEKVSVTKGDGFSTKIEMTYEAVVEFIKWYNGQNK